MMLAKHSILAGARSDSRVREALRRGLRGVAGLLLLAVCFAVSGAAQCGQAADQCTTGEMKPLFRVSNAKTVSAKPREVEEIVKLKGGMKVSVKQGGCAHYGIQVSFTEKEKADTVASALKVLRQLSPLAETNEAFDQMIQLIEKYGAKTPLGEPMQDKQFEFTTVDVNREVNAGLQKITVTFSFAL
jgi:hypothetical protein